MLVLGEGPTNTLDNITITAEAKCSISITKSKKKIGYSYVFNEK